MSETGGWGEWVILVEYSALGRFEADRRQGQRQRAASAVYAVHRHFSARRTHSECSFKCGSPLVGDSPHLGLTLCHCSLRPNNLQTRLISKQSQYYISAYDNRRNTNQDESDDR